MKLMDYHTHNKRCGHATGKIEDYILEGIKKNLGEIGITDHFPVDILPIPPKFRNIINTVSMSKDDFSSYISEIKRLREKYKSSIHVKISTEIGFNSPKRALSYQKQFIKSHMDDLDYILGGIHTVKMADDSILTLTVLDDRQKVNLDDLTYRYLNQMDKLVSSDFFDIIAHLDNNRIQYIPNEIVYSEENWEFLLNILDKIKSKGIVIEVNTSGSWKGVFRQFPNDDILEEIILRDIAVTLGSDAHNPNQVGYGFEEFIEKAKKMGLKSISSFNHREQIKNKI